MHSDITAQEIAEKFELLDPPQKQTVYSFINTLLSNSRESDVAAQKRRLLQTSVWSKRDIGHVREAQKDVNEWRIPTW